MESGGVDRVRSWSYRDAEKWCDNENCGARGLFAVGGRACVCGWNNYCGEWRVERDGVGMEEGGSLKRTAQEKGTAL